MECCPLVVGSKLDLARRNTNAKRCAMREKGSSRSCVWWTSLRVLSTNYRPHEFRIGSRLVLALYMKQQREALPQCPGSNRRGLHRKRPEQFFCHSDRVAFSLNLQSHAWNMDFGRRDDAESTRHEVDRKTAKVVGATTLHTLRGFLS